ncbi:MAG: pyridine nucleotide-disulfide oxidoreductase [Clostridia bacterium]|nr:pyridine nucleotide-disulfide oxidoreductase [Clostridia bacterium]
MKKTDLLVIGGSAGGILSATTARKAYGDISITIIRETEKVMVPCGIPYIFGTLMSTAKNVIPDASLIENNIELVVDRVVKIDRTSKLVITEKNETIEYKKLIISTGSLPIIPTFIPGHNLKNVFPVLKDANYLNTVLEEVEKAKNVAVIGGGFIGVEFAEQINLLGKNVTLIELADACLWQAFDKDFTDDIGAHLKESGITVLTGTKVKRIVGEKIVEAIELDSGEKIPADLVILGLGVKPNSSLAEEAGIQLNDKGAIVVDQYTRTSDPSVFAVGDCAEKKCFFTGKNVPVLLASTAAMEAKIAGCNAFHLRLVRTNQGTISAFSTKICGKAFAAAGITEDRALQEGFSIMVGNFTTLDRHPGSLPGAQQTKMKLIFSKCSGIILGAQISGGDSIAEMINILSLAIQKGLTATELNTFQVATHPLTSASPIAYPINAAAMNAIATTCKHLNEGLVI